MNVILGAYQCRRGRGQGLYTSPTPQLNPHLKGGAGAELLLPHPLHTFEDHPLRLGRHHDSPLRCPHTMPQCLRPHGWFPSPPDTPSVTLMPHPIMMWWFIPPSSTTFCLWYSCPNTPKYNPPQSFIFDSPPPIPF